MKALRTRLYAIAASLAAVLPAHAADKLRLALPPAYTPIAVVVYAHEKGYFKEKDIDAELTVYRGGAAAQEAVAAGGADMAAIASPGAAVAIQKGVRQKIVGLAGPTSPNGWFMVVPRDSAIRTVQDLNGRKVGITGKASSTDYFSLKSAAEGGGTIQSIPLGAGILPALKARQVDAGVLWPLSSFHAVQGGEYRQLVDYGKAVKDTSMDVWLATDELIARKPEVIRRAFEALAKAVTEFQRDEKTAIAFLAKYHDEKDGQILKLAYDTLIKPLRPDHHVRPEWVDNALKLAAAGGATNLPRAADIVDNRYTVAR